MLIFLVIALLLFADVYHIVSNAILAFVHRTVLKIKYSYKMCF